MRASDPYFNKLVRIMATRCMTQAVYFNSGELSVPEYHHYGLAAPLYTHFTSPIRRCVWGCDVGVRGGSSASAGFQLSGRPLRGRVLFAPSPKIPMQDAVIHTDPSHNPPHALISSHSRFPSSRRYADVVVHRVLMAALGLAPLPGSMRDRPRVADTVDNLNVRHKNAQLAGRASVELHTLIFFRGRTVVADARVTRVMRVWGGGVWEEQVGVGRPCDLLAQGHLGGAMVPGGRRLACGGCEWPGRLYGLCFRCPAPRIPSNSVPTLTPP